MFLQVRERLRVALERNTALEEELALTKEEVSFALFIILLAVLFTYIRALATEECIPRYYSLKTYKRLPYDILKYVELLPFLIHGV